MSDWKGLFGSAAAKAGIKKETHSHGVRDEMAGRGQPPGGPEAEASSRRAFTSAMDAMSEASRAIDDVEDVPEEMREKRHFAPIWEAAKKVDTALAEAEKTARAAGNTAGADAAKGAREQARLNLKRSYVTELIADGKGVVAAENIRWASNELESHGSKSEEPKPAAAAPASPAEIEAAIAEGKHPKFAAAMEAAGRLEEVAWRLAADYDSDKPPVPNDPQVARAKAISAKVQEEFEAIKPSAERVLAAAQAFSDANPGRSLKSGSTLSGVVDFMRRQVDGLSGPSEKRWGGGYPPGPHEANRRALSLGRADADSLRSVARTARVLADEMSKK